VKERLRSAIGLGSPRLGKRHQPSGLNTRINAGDHSFIDYVSRSREMLAQAHSGMNAVDLQKIVEGNCPFELMPSMPGSEGKQKRFRRGVLLSHGLTDSPYLMRHLASFFQQQGFRVMAILLPGHGTQPGDLLDVRWTDWAETVAYGTDRLSEEVDEIYLAGYSAGGALSVYQSLRDDRVRGLFLFSPAIRVSPRAAFANLHKLYSWMNQEAKWVDIMPDLDIYKYESFPKNGAAQMHALIQAVNRRLRKQEMKIPVFAAASLDDATVDATATVAFMEQAHHPSNRLVLYTTDTAAFRSGLAAENLELVNSMVPEKKIFSSAHTGIVIPPSDTHYGEAGDYANCLHYYPDAMEKYTACITHPESALQGEVTENITESGMIRRLTYNPDFAGLMGSMSRFIEDLP
jgi:esterase/lipase